MTLPDAAGYHARVRVLLPPPHPVGADSVTHTGRKNLLFAGQSTAARVFATFADKSQFLEGLK